MSPLSEPVPLALLLQSIPARLSDSNRVKLTHCRFLLAENVFSEIIIYEQRDSVGGVWNYTPRSSKLRESVNGDGNPRAPPHPEEVVTANLPKLNTPMYDGLESNLPHVLMQFSDTPFPDGTQLFAPQETVLQYLRDYANDLIQRIEFDHQVVSVRPTKGHERPGWEITTTAVAGGEKKVEKFDAVVAANGHCDWPLLPEIDGLSAWSKKYPESLYHSVSFKNTKAFENKVSDVTSYSLCFIKQSFH